jgi:hypothetical protein
LETEFDFKADVEIDPHALDVEWLRQASLYQKYAGEAAKARDRRDRTKDYLEIVRAEIDSQIRKDPEKWGIAKITEGAISAIITQSAKYISANEEYFRTKLETDLLQSAVISLDQKKSALENLVKLMGQGYFAGPSVPRDLNAEWTESIKERGEALHEEVTEKLRRRK